LLGPDDRLTLIGLARTPRLLFEAVPGIRVREALDAAAATPAEGGTNLEAALKLGAELAQRHRLPGARNRIVLLTDGAANLGNADPARLAATIELLRQGGIAFDACGVGAGLDDAMLEPLTRKGDGRYYVIDSPAAADAGFARQLAGAFRPAAENVKVQVRFNPARVARYRLIGFEKHRLNEADFRNDAVDAAELAAEENAVALYQVEPLPQGDGELGEVSVRFRDPATGTMVERTWALTYDARTPAFDRATPSLQLAGLAALLAEKLRATAPADPFKLDDLVGVMTKVRSHYASQPRVQDFARMFERVRRDE
jgi:secreted protein with Ig-like and vWFA domain